MKWLVNCDDVAVNVAETDTREVEPGSEMVAPDIVVKDNGEQLEDVTSHLAAWWVYSWLDFEYRPKRLLLREGLISKLVAAEAALPIEMKLVILDGWRSRSFQDELHSYYSASLGRDITGFVADPSRESSNIPPHITGGAVDLTLCWRGAPLGLGSDFDEFSPASGACRVGYGSGRLSGRAKALRCLMGESLAEAGLVSYPLEWWHWSYGDQLWAMRRGEQHALYGELDVTGQVAGR